MKLHSSFLVCKTLHIVLLRFQAAVIEFLVSGSANLCILHFFELAASYLCTYDTYYSSIQAVGTC